MVTLTIGKQVKKGSTFIIKTEVKTFKSIDKLRKEISPIVREMKEAKNQKRQAKTFIKAVSYDDKSEKSLLLQMDAITSIENEKE